MTLKKCLVLGGAGFIGRNLVKSLVANGFHPRVFTRPSRSVESLRSMIEQIEVVYADFMDDVALRRAVEGIEVVFHLISTTFPSMTLYSSVYDILSNLLPTIRLVEACLSQGVRKIVYASSGGTIYGEPQGNPVTENHPLTPLSAYGQSKLSIENHLLFYARVTSLEVDILRLSNPYGPGQKLVGVQGVVSIAMGCILHDRVLDIYDNGQAIRDYIYIDDVVRALIRAAENKGSHLLNISTNIGTSVNELVQRIQEVTRQTIRMKSVAGRPGDVRVSVLSNERAKALLNWVPQIPLREGLQRTWESIEKQA